MKRNNRTQIRMALGAGLLATLGLLPQARAELVYEPEGVSEVSNNTPAQVRAEDRAATRDALEASERVQTTVQSTRLVSEPQAAVQPEVQSQSRTELMRRERTRTELKNEDILQERLEELRLRDEKRRGQQLLGDGTAAQQEQA